MKFRYLQLPGRVKSPIVMIGVSFGGSSFRIPCLVDSGADVSFMPTAFAAMLGITDVGSGDEHIITGVTKHTMKAYGHDVVFTLGGWQQKERFYFGDVGQDMGILGRTFFRKYKVTFDQRGEEVEFRDYPDKK